MTDDKDFKRLVRQRMAKTGESYATARARLRPQPGRTGAPPLTVAAFREEVLSRSSLESLGAHLEGRYGIRATRLVEQDLGVYRVDRGGEPAWIARVFPAARPLELLEGDAEILQFVAGRGVAAERCAHDEPVSVLDGQGVLVTECLPGLNGRSDTRGDTLFRLGALVGQVTNLPSSRRDGAMDRAAGSWHHLSVAGGGRRSDVETLLSLLDEAESRVAVAETPLFDRLRARLGTIDALDDLPQALVHPDPGGANAIVSPGGEPSLIDWTGAGRGPRLLPFANLIAGCLQTQPDAAVSHDLRRVDAVVAGYRDHIRLTPEELTRLPDAIAAFGIIILGWSYLFQEVPLPATAQALDERDRMATEAAERVRWAVEQESDTLTAWFREAPPAVHEGQGRLL
jgi:Ser/Thr protein kinase RdoA (MazF antagonist)